ncbi:MAG: FecR domain-containing protein [Odoribacter splanchnicus]
MGWKDNQLIFHKETLEEIMRILARWYDIEVVFENNDLNNWNSPGT